MIQISIGEKNAFNRAVSQSQILWERLQFRRSFYLPGQVRRGIDQERALTIRPDPNARLGLRRNPTAPRGKAVWTRTIPLRQATPRRTPENPKTNRLTPGRLDRARVACALKEDWHVSHRGFNPFFLGAFHQRHKASPYIKPARELAIIASLVKRKSKRRAWTGLGIYVD